MFERRQLIAQRKNLSDAEAAANAEKKARTRLLERAAIDKRLKPPWLRGGNR
jgi:hypothetical protein